MKTKLKRREIKIKNKRSWLIVLSLFIISILLLFFSSCDNEISVGWDFVPEPLKSTDDCWSMNDTGTVNYGYPYLTGLVPE